VICNHIYLLWQLLPNVWLVQTQPSPHSDFPGIQASKEVYKEQLNRKNCCKTGKKKKQGTIAYFRPYFSINICRHFVYQCETIKVPWCLILSLANKKKSRSEGDTTCGICFDHRTWLFIYIQDNKSCRRRITWKTTTKQTFRVLTLTAPGCDFWHAGYKKRNMRLTWQLAS
jgi:hypothetical protein